MPAFGKDGIVNVNGSLEKEVWNIVDSNGKVIMVCNDQNQANVHCANLSLKSNRELKVERGTIKCL